MSRQEPEAPEPAVKASEKAAPSVGGQPLVSFYPQVPAKLPDLSQGYLFNEERLLASEPKEGVEEKVEEPGDGIKLDMDQLFYAGSIIIGDNRKALVSYVDVQTKTSQPAAKSRAKKKDSSKKQYAQLKVNDQLGGYTVTEVEAGHITFERAGKSIEKKLHDSSKVRIKPAARKKVVARRTSTSSPGKKVSLGTPSSRSRPVTSQKARTPKVVQSKRVRTPAGSNVRNIQPPVSR